MEISLNILEELILIHFFFAFLKLEVALVEILFFNLYNKQLS